MQELVDRLVVDEYGRFESDPFGYTVDRRRAVEALVADGADETEARAAWDAFAREYLAPDGSDGTFSSHGIDRARSLGEDVHVDGSVHGDIVERLDGNGGSAPEDGLRDAVGVDGEVFEQNLWMLQRRGVVELSENLYGDGRTVRLRDTDSDGG